MSSLVADPPILASHFSAVQYTTIASTAILVYDWGITLADEVEHVWRSDWNVVKILFLGTRYMPMISTALICIYFMHPGLHSDICTRLINTSTIISCFGVASAVVTLLMRTYALWGRSRRLLVALSTLLLTTSIFGIVVLSISRSRLEFLNTNITGTVPCMSDRRKIGKVPGVLIYINIMLLDSVVIGLTMYKAISDWKFRPCQNVLYRTFHRDGLLYFLSMFTLSCASLIINILNVAKGDYDHLLLQLQLAFHSIISARMFLNLRNASTKLVAGKDTISLPAIEFMSPTIGSDTTGTTMTASFDTPEREEDLMASRT